MTIPFTVTNCAILLKGKAQFVTVDRIAQLEGKSISMLSVQYMDIKKQPSSLEGAFVSIFVSHSEFSTPNVLIRMAGFGCWLR